MTKNRKTLNEFGTATSAPDSSEELEPTDRGEIGGIVFLENRDTLAIGATVAAVRCGEREYAQIVTTGDDGRYRLTGLTPGRFFVQAWRGSWTMKRTAFPQPRIRVDAGTRVEHVDLTLAQGVVVSGQVVEEGTEAPIVGASVAWGRTLFTRTNTEGLFSLEGVAAGNIRLTVWGELHASQSVETQAEAGDEPSFYIELEPGGIVRGMVTTVGGRAAPEVLVTLSSNYVKVEDRADSEGRFRLEGVPLTSRSLEVRASYGGQHETRQTVMGFPLGERELLLDLTLNPGFAVSGQTLDEEGQPITGAKLFIDWASWEVLATTDDEGRFSIEGAIESMRVLTARADGYAPASIDLAELSVAARADVRLELRAGENVEGSVVDPDGDPVQGALVFITTDDRYAGPYPSTISREDGKFSLFDLPERVQTIGAMKIGYSDGRVEGVRSGASDLRLVMPEAGRIMGVVVNRVTGEPVPRFTVKLKRSKDQFVKGSTRASLPMSLGRRGVQFSSEDGNFSMTENVQTGVRYDLVVVAPEYAEAVVSAVVAQAPSEQSVVVTVELERGETIYGRVSEVPGGAAIGDVRVYHVVSDDLSVWWELSRGESDMLRASITDAEGEFAISGVTADRGMILLEKRGYARTAYRNVRPRGDVSTFELAREAIVDGQVWMAGGVEPPPLTVVVHVNDQKFSGGITGSDGSFRVVGLPAGEGTLEFRHPIMSKTTTTVVLSADETTFVDVRLAATSDLVGSVVDATTGAPTGGAYVKLLRVSSDQRGWERSREKQLATDQSTFRFEGLEPGAYALTTAMDKRAGNLGWSGPFELSGVAGLVEVQLILGGASALTVSVVDAKEGSSVQGVYAALQPLFGERAPIATIARSQGDGEVSFTELPRSRYRLTLDAPDYLRRIQEVDVSEDNQHVKVALEPAGLIVVNVEGNIGDGTTRLVIARLSGGDTGWHKSGENQEVVRRLRSQSRGPDSVQFKTRPGTYRMRFSVVSGAAVGPGTVLASRVEDLVVPEKGRVDVQVRAIDASEL